MKFTWLVRVHSWVNPIVFGNSRPNRTTDTEENVSPKPVFRVYVRRYGVFWEKNLKTVFDTRFPLKKVIFIFLVRRPVPSKKVMHPKNNFSLLSCIILFFSKILLNKKYSKPQCLQKRIYWFLSTDTTLPSKQSFYKRVFRSFLQKYYFFSKNLFNNKTSVT